MLYYINAALEEAFERVPQAIKWILRRQRVPERLALKVIAVYQGDILYCK